MVPLRPFEHPEHDDLYVDVCGSTEAFAAAMAAFADFEHLAEGGYVLVAGESGCGKTAMLNRLADRVRSGLGRVGLRASVIDMTNFLEDQERSLEHRMTRVCQRLQALLGNADLLRRGAENLWARYDDPRLIFPELDTALEPGTAAVVLLPSPGDLKQEVIRFAKPLSSRRVVFLAESSLLADRLVEIEEELEDFRPAVVVEMRTLTPEDVDRFVADRLGRGPGGYPPVTAEGLRRLSIMCPSVKTLQRTAHGTYQMLLRQGGGSYPGEGYAVGAEDFRRYQAEQLRRGGRR
jgi:energy-coupling factor transporter ATP-binding protein EcfA2